MKITRKNLEKLIKEEIYKIIKEEEYVEDDYRIGNLPTNKVISVDQTVPQIMKEVQKIKTRLRKLEESNRKNVGNEN